MPTSFPRPVRSPPRLSTASNHHQTTAHGSHRRSLCAALPTISGTCNGSPTPPPRSKHWPIARGSAVPLPPCGGLAMALSGRSTNPRHALGIRANGGHGIVVTSLVS